MSIDMTAFRRSGGRSALPDSVASILHAFAAPSRLLLAACAGLRSRRACRELAALDDNMLRDIGVSRSNIEHAVHFGRLRGNRH